MALCLCVFELTKCLSVYYVFVLRVDKMSQTVCVVFGSRLSVSLALYVALVQLHFCVHCYFYL